MMKSCHPSVSPRESGDPEWRGLTQVSLGPRLRGDERKGLIHSKGMRGAMSEVAA